MCQKVPLIPNSFLFSCYMCINVMGSYILHINYMPRIPDLLPGLHTGQYSMYTNLQDIPAKSGKAGNYDCKQESRNLRLWLWVRGELWDFSTLTPLPHHPRLSMLFNTCKKNWKGLVNNWCNDDVSATVCRNGVIITLLNRTVFLACVEKHEKAWVRGYLHTKRIVAAVHTHINTYTRFL